MRRRVVVRDGGVRLSRLGMQRLSPWKAPLSKAERSSFNAPTRLFDRGQSNRIVPRAGLNRDPAQVGELRYRCLAAKPPIATLLHAAERHLRFVVHSRPVDMADARFD